MEIKDLQPKQGNVEVVGEVVEMGEVREFEKFGKSGKVCNAKIKDATGEISLSLWNEQIDMLKVGDTVHITNGYVNEWQGNLQLTTGKFGKMEVQEGNASKPEGMQSDHGSHIVTDDEKTEEEVLDEENNESSSAEESETDDEKTEEDINVEEEEVKFD